MERTEFVLNKELIPYLSMLAGDKPSPVSPWSRVEAKELENEGWKKLAEAGLTGENGNIKKEIMEVVKLLREASRFVRLRLRSGPVVMEHMLYSCGSGKLVSFTSQNDDLLIRYPAPSFIILNAVIEYFGSSKVVSSDLDLEVDIETAIVFALLVDMCRRQILSDRAAMRSGNLLVSKLDEVEKAATETPDDGQWLVTALKSFTKWEGSLDQERIEKAMQQLIEKQVVEKTEQGYSLRGEGLAAANNFLLLSQALRLDIAAQKDEEEDDGELIHSGMLCLNAGIHDNLYVDREGDKLKLETVSAAFIKDVLQTFFVQDFDAKSLTTEEVEEAEEEAKEKEKEKEKEATAAKTEKQPEIPEVKYFALKEGQQYGPFTGEILEQYALEGRLSGDDLVWHEGLPEWIPLKKL